MNAGSAFHAIRLLAYDTFRQARASGVFWFMLAVSVSTIALCLTTTLPIDAEESQPAVITLAFGVIRIPAENGVLPAVRTLQTYLAGLIADSAGLLLSLLWTAGFLPAFLESSSASVLLAKPTPRWMLIGGKFLGVLGFVAYQALVFIAGTWFAIGLRTGVWDAVYFFCVPILLLHFAVFFSFSAMLASATRSTVVCVFGSVLFWVLCWGMNFGRHATLAIPDLQGVSAVLASSVEIGYWVMPKPLDFHIILLDSLDADNVFARMVDTTHLIERGAWRPIASVLASIVCAVILFAIATYDFAMADY